MVPYGHLTLSSLHRLAGLPLECKSCSLKTTRFDECCPSGRGSSLNLIVLVFVSGPVSLSQVDNNCVEIKTLLLLLQVERYFSFL